jgi:hypothetical protein
VSTDRVAYLHTEEAVKSVKTVKTLKRKEAQTALEFPQEIVSKKDIGRLLITNGVENLRYACKGRTHERVRSSLTDRFKGAC